MVIFQKGWLDFDLVIAEPSIMSKVGRVGKILGTKGLMPSPKSGTVTPDYEKAIRLVLKLPPSINPFTRLDPP